MVKDTFRTLGMVRSLCFRQVGKHPTATLEMEMHFALVWDFLLLCITSV